MKNIFTIDLEDYYHCNFRDEKFKENKKFISTVEQNVEELLEIFREYNTKVTFFVLGKVAEEIPELISKIAREGHEIASHGYAHRLIYKQTQGEFEEDIMKSKNLLESIINKPILGYRAPSWSITNTNKWAIKVIENVGFKYSSSIFPTKNFLYGIEDAPIFANKPIYNDEELDILEIPPSTYKFFGKSLGFSGGFYFRLFPFFIINKLIKKANKTNNPVICYLHPWEIDKNTPYLTLPFLEKIIHYYGIKRSKSKLVKLLKKHEFTSIERFYFNKDIQ